MLTIQIGESIYKTRIKAIENIKIISRKLINLILIILYPLAFYHQVYTDLKGPIGEISFGRQERLARRGTRVLLVFVLLSLELFWHFILLLVEIWHFLISNNDS